MRTIGKWILILGAFGLVLQMLGYDGNNKEETKPKVVEKKTTSKTINEAGRAKAIARWNDPGYTKAYFPQKESFWILLKSPPPNADLYAELACRAVKEDYNISGFTITVWDFNNKKYGKARCY